MSPATSDGYAIPSPAVFSDLLMAVNPLILFHSIALLSLVWLSNRLSIKVFFSPNVFLNAALSFWKASLASPTLVSLWCKNMNVI